MEYSEAKYQHQNISILSTMQTILRGKSNPKISNIFFKIIIAENMSKNSCMMKPLYVENIYKNFDDRWQSVITQQADTFLHTVKDVNGICFNKV